MSDEALRALLASTNPAIAHRAAAVLNRHSGQYTRRSSGNHSNRTVPHNCVEVRRGKLEQAQRRLASLPSIEDLYPVAVRAENPDCREWLTGKMKLVLKKFREQRAANPEPCKISYDEVLDLMTDQCFQDEKTVLEVLAIEAEIAGHIEWIKTATNHTTKP